MFGLTEEQIAEFGLTFGVGALAVAQAIGGVEIESVFKIKLGNEITYEKGLINLAEILDRRSHAKI